MSKFWKYLVVLCVTVSVYLWYFSSHRATTKWTRNNDGNIVSTEQVVGEFKRDPLEFLPEFAEAFRIANSEAEKMVSNENGRRVRPPFIFYREKKRILKERFHIEWKTPIELNPGTLFD